MTHTDDTIPTGPHEVREDDDLQREVMGFLQRVSFDGWSNPEATRAAALILWRRTRDELMTRAAGENAHVKGDALWEHMPADTRVPDHSILGPHADGRSARVPRQSHGREEPGRDRA